jgi:hypothetical protein
MALTGSLWRIKKNPAMDSVWNPGIPVYLAPHAPRTVPGTYKYMDGDDPVGYLTPNDAVLIGSECVDVDVFEQRSRGSRATFVKVLLPFTGYVNSTYFLKDSLWAERVS